MRNGTTERIRKTNAIARSKIRKMAKENKGCYLVILTYQGSGLWIYYRGMVENFGCYAIVPYHDEKLMELIMRKHELEPLYYTDEYVKAIWEINKRVEELGGEVLVWA